MFSNSLKCISKFYGQTKLGVCIEKGYTSELYPVHLVELLGISCWMTRNAFKNNINISYDIFSRVYGIWINLYAYLQTQSIHTYINSYANIVPYISYMEGVCHAKYDSNLPKVALKYISEKLCVCWLNISFIFHMTHTTRCSTKGVHFIAWDHPLSAAFDCTGITPISGRGRYLDSTELNCYRSWQNTGRTKQLRAQFVSLS